MNYLQIRMPSTDDESDSAILELKSLIDSHLQTSIITTTSLLTMMTDEVTFHHTLFA